MLKLSTEQLKMIMPNCKAPAAWAEAVNDVLPVFEINNVRRLGAFLAQLAHESGEFRWLEEFASGAAYEGRRDLGNTQKGDGVRYKGRGPIQLTGRANYEKYGKLLGLDLLSKPELVSTANVGMRVAGLYWQSHGLNELADAMDFEKITRKINGGLNGIEDRKNFYTRARAVLGF